MEQNKADERVSRERIAYWTNLICRCQQRPEKLSAKQWLDQNNVNRSLYYYWKRRLAQSSFESQSIPEQHPSESEEQRIAFAEIKLAKPVPFVKEPFSSTDSQEVTCNAYAQEDASTSSPKPPRTAPQEVIPSDTTRETIGIESFQASALLRTPSMTVAISNTINDRLLNQILREVSRV
jgi:hypothetical protein